MQAVLQRNGCRDAGATTPMSLAEPVLSTAMGLSPKNTHSNTEVRSTASNFLPNESNRTRNSIIPSVEVGRAGYDLDEDSPDEVGNMRRRDPCPDSRTPLLYDSSDSDEEPSIGLRNKLCQPPTNQLLPASPNEYDGMLNLFTKVENEDGSPYWPQKRMESMDVHTRTAFLAASSYRKAQLEYYIEKLRCEQRARRLKSVNNCEHAFQKPSLWRLGPPSLSSISVSVFGAALSNPSQAGLSLKACGSGSDLSDDSSSEDEERDMRNDRHNLYRTIRTVLSRSRDYADAMVNALQRQIQRLKTHSHASSKGSVFPSDIFNTLGNQAEYEASNEGSPSGGKRSTGRRIRAGSLATSVSSSNMSRTPTSIKRKRDDDEEEEDEQNDLSSKKQFWLCPYGVRYQQLAFGACRTPTAFRSFSDLSKHLRKRHTRNRNARDGDVRKHAELYMSDKQEMAIITKAKTANLKRPKRGTETSFEKHQGLFHAVWGILFPTAGPAPESPFCEDFKSGEPGMLSDSIFSSWSDRAFKRGEVSDPADFQASRKDFNEMAQELLATFRDHRPNLVGSSQPLPSDSMTSNQRFGSLGAAAETPERTFLQSPGLTPNWSPFGDEHSRRVSFDSHVLVSDDPVVQPGSAAADMIRWRTAVSQELRQYPEFPMRLPTTEASIPVAPVPSVWYPAEDFADFDDFLRTGSFYTSGETQSFQTIDAPLNRVPLVSTMDPMITSDSTPGVGVNDTLNYYQWDDGGISASTSAMLHPMHFTPPYEDIEEE